VHGLRFQEGFQSGDEYFYQVQIKTINYNDCDTFYNGNWMEINKLYRYSFDQKKSFVYVSVDDPEPKLLFDFNCSVGDTVFLDEEMYVRMLVTAIDEQQIDGVGFPVVSGKIISFSRDSYFNSNDDILIGSNNLSLTPFSPNPFWAGSSIGTYFNSSWNNSDFCVPATAARVHGIKMACKNLLNSSIFSSYYFVVPD
jgi:hypothetical protein